MRFEDFIAELPNGCVEWQGPTDSHGYGRFGKERAHRAAWRLQNGAIPDDLHAHHLCGNKLCVNPDHLELLTAVEHNAVHRPETCPSGHAPDWRITSRGTRVCRKCDLERKGRRPTEDANSAARSQNDLCSNSPIGDMRSQAASDGGLLVSGGTVPSIFGGTGRPRADESARRRREFIRLVAEGVPFDKAAEEARVHPRRALAILSHPDVRPLLTRAA